ncbi:MAG TPA: hypothetical protein VE053_00415 [Allosphingosinicella sp.]|nr:hypothetical protein [Allosphingosinicella sp.]
MADSAYSKARGTAAGPETRPGAHRAAGPQLDTLQRLKATLDDSPRVAALRQIGSRLSARNPATAGGQSPLQRVSASSNVIQRNGSLFELTIPTRRSGYRMELRGHEAYSWIVTQHGRAAIQDIRKFAPLVFQDGGMFVQAASREWVMGLIGHVHLSDDVAVGEGRSALDGEDEDRDDGGPRLDARDEGSDADEEDAGHDELDGGEEIGGGAAWRWLQPFTLFEPQPEGAPLTGKALYETLRDLHGDMLAEFSAQIDRGQLTVRAENIQAVEQRLDEEGLRDIRIWRSRDDIARELPDLTIGTMKAINAKDTIKYPHNAPLTVGALVDHSPGQLADLLNSSNETFEHLLDLSKEEFVRLKDAGTGFADPEYFAKTGRFTWVLRPFKSAAKAIESFVNLTRAVPVIAECQTAAQAVEYYAILGAVGRRRFDAKLGREDEETPQDERLRLQFSLDAKNPIKEFYEPSRAGLDEEEEAGLGQGRQGPYSGPGHRPAMRGGRYFIQGPKNYSKRHPEGFLGGENAFYYGDEEGEQRFGGLGIENRSELEIAGILAEDFNRAPTQSERRRSPVVDPTGLHRDVLPPRQDAVAEDDATVYRASAAEVATVHRASALRARKEALDGAPVRGSRVNRGATWLVVEGQLGMHRTGCGKVSLGTLAKAYADALGLEYSRVLIDAVRAENLGKFDRASMDQVPQAVDICFFPDPETLLRLAKGTGFQATNAQILDSGKIHRAFSPKAQALARSTF